MQIIVVSSRFSKAKTIVLGPATALATALIAVIVVLLASAGLMYLGVNYLQAARIPAIERILGVLRQEEAARNEQQLRASLNALALQLGDLQARLLRLDALGQRLAGQSGIKPSELRFDVAPGRGGAAAAPNLGRALSALELQTAMRNVSARIEWQDDYLHLVESELMLQRIKRKMLPTVAPIAGTWNASSFGWRIDPITGLSAFHEGVDFIAQSGTPIVAAAGGVVVFAGYLPEFGNMVEIDHGKGFTSRYAHASRILVREGAMAKSGEVIAEVGSTGRSTGSHLHFEIRHDGVPLNPNAFLAGTVKSQ